MNQFENPELLVVHAVDAEGPLNETMEATFERLKYIFDIDLEANHENLQKLKLGVFKTGDLEIDEKLIKVFSGDILNYNKNWHELDLMNKKIFSKGFRNKYIDDFNNLWKITWFCLDHVNYLDNPREKAIGYSVVFNYYKNLIMNHNFGDEIQWHFHPKALSQSSISAATSYANSMNEIIQILCRKILDDYWFPTCFRPGFHAERQDCNLFLEQWIPFDYGNQRVDGEAPQSDMENGRFGNWEWAPITWRGYKPSSTHYDKEGSLNRTIFRCLNLGTRLRLLNRSHVIECFQEAHDSGNAILAFTDHDFRDITPDIEYLYNELHAQRRKFPGVKIRFCTAEEAAQRIINKLNYRLELTIKLENNILKVSLKEGQIFGSQPFLAIKGKRGDYFSDNFDCLKHDAIWTYTFDEQTINLSDVELIGVAAGGKFGGHDVKILKL